MYHRQRGAHVAAGEDQSFGNVGNEHLEDENSQAETELRSKVSALKSLSIDIGTEVREHNRLLKDVDDEFDSTFGHLQNNIQKVLKLVKSGNRYHMVYLFLFCLFVFFVLWCLI
jgi:blocked-early-in-transport protein 1